MRGRQRHCFSDLADIVNSSIRGGVNFNDVKSFFLMNSLAIGAFKASFHQNSLFDFLFLFVLAVYCFGKQSGQSRFSCSSGSGEKIGVADAVVFDGIGKGS